MQKITPFLWFDHQAEEAVQFYTSIFKDSKTGSVTRNGEHGPGPDEAVLVMDFELKGQKFIALNGGPMFNFTPAISFLINCEDQAEVDYYWEKLTAGGEEVQCGWLKDKFGVSWQVVPKQLGELMSSPDRERAGRVMAAMMKMVKMDVAGLQAAYDAVS